MTRAELFEQFLHATDQLNRGIARAGQNDRLAFAEIAASMRELADAADKLAAEELP